MRQIQTRSGSGEEGFSYIDVLIALVIFMIGIVGYLTAMSAGILMSRGQQYQLTARHIAATTMESIMAAKETDPARLGWDAVGNVGSNVVNGVPRGIFLTGQHQAMANAGPDEVVGTADDNGGALAGYTRTITITDICDPDRPSYNCPTPGAWPIRMRSVRITINYFVGTAPRTETIATVLTDYSVKE